MESLTMTLGGMGCGGCVKNVQKVLGSLPGVTVGDVAVGWATLRFDPTRLSRQTIAAALAGAGYPVHQDETINENQQTIRESQGDACGLT